MGIPKNHLFLYFLMGVSAVITPWAALLIVILLYFKGNKYSYYSASNTSLVFLLGGVFGALFGYFLLGTTFLEWWSPSSKGLTRLLLGKKLWIPALLFGASVVGVLREFFKKYKETRGGFDENDE